MDDMPEQSVSWAGAPADRGLDDFLEESLVRTEVIGPDENGIKIVRTIRPVEAGKRKIVEKKYRVTKKTKVMPASVARRLKLKKFGERAGQEGMEASSFIGEEVRLEVAVVQKQRDATARGRDEQRKARRDEWQQELSLLKETLRKKNAASRKSGLGIVGSQKDDADIVSNKIRISNLPDNVTQDQLFEECSKFGLVESVYIVKDRVTRRSRGFGFVEFQHENSAAKAKKALQGYAIWNVVLHVEYAKDRRF
eukprot:TRINITY_DN141_c0_g1_i1.p1 TRINITY_DN141_c0_g1~~TRINITY_DN141_c0_g1_i1.p1  ORF type:complete len:252 (-),score=81.67 TRINITY_DN141_c0_g1_i1:177-932(-)